MVYLGNDSHKNEPYIGALRRPIFSVLGLFTSLTLGQRACKSTLMGVLLPQIDFVIFIGSKENALFNRARNSQYQRDGRILRRIVTLQPGW